MIERCAKHKCYYDTANGCPFCPSRVERLEMRLACWALAEFFGDHLYAALRVSWRCECGHTFDEHCTPYARNPVGVCFYDDADRHEPSRRCACRAFHTEPACP